MREGSSGVAVLGPSLKARAPSFRYGAEATLACGSIAAVVLLLAASEGLLRRLRPSLLADRPQASLAQLHRYSEQLGWEPRPRAVLPVYGQHTSINEDGLRGSVHPPSRSDRPRVLLLGDSVAFGYGVADDATFAAKLEERVYEVVNLAVPGYGTDQELLRLERRGTAYHPDVVALHFCAHNDFADNASHTYFYDGLHPKPYFTVEQGQLIPHAAHLRLGPLSRAGLWLHEHSFLYNAVAGRPSPVASDWSERRTAALRDEVAVRDLTIRLIARIAEVARGARASFVLFVHPGRRQFREGSPWLAALREAPELREVRQVDMAARFAARGRPLASLTLDPIGHLNAAGHSEAAAVVEETLRETLAGR